MSDYHYEIRYRYAENPQAFVFKGEVLVARKTGGLRSVRRWAKRLVRQAEKHGDIAPAPGFNDKAFKPKLSAASNE